MLIVAGETWPSFERTLTNLSKNINSTTPRGLASKGISCFYSATCYVKYCANYLLLNVYVKDDGVRIKSRKVLVHEEVVLDYDYPGANPRHDPRKGKPPKNP